MFNNFWIYEVINFKDFDLNWLILINYKLMGKNSIMYCVY